MQRTLDRETQSSRSATPLLTQVLVPEYSVGGKMTGLEASCG